jgi:hypothetical protein
MCPKTSNQVHELVSVLVGKRSKNYRKGIFQVGMWSGKLKKIRQGKTLRKPTRKIPRVPFVFSRMGECSDLSPCIK